MSPLPQPFSPRRGRRQRRARAAVIAALSACLVISGCTGQSQDPQPPSPSASQKQNPADSVVAALAKALSTGSWAGVPIVGDSTAAAKVAKDYAVIVGGMDGVYPQVATSPVAYGEDGIATVELRQTYSFGDATWSYTSTAKLNDVNGTWMVAWAPSIVHPDLNELSRLRHRRTLPTRAPILGSKGEALMEERPVLVVGVDKNHLDKARWESVATQIATTLKIDVKAYVAKVKAAGEKAYVPALTVRESELPDKVLQINGASVTKSTAVLAPYRAFARALLGTVGEASPEQVKQSKGAIWAGDRVGQTGLQARYDAQLRGKAEHTVEMVTRTNSTPDPGSTAQPAEDVTLFHQDSTAGKPLKLTLEQTAQTKAEDVLSTVSPVSAMVVIRPSDGAILAAATSPAAGDNPYATFGRYAPGSTFKVVSSLAMVRKGMSPNSMVNCPATIEVNGRTFKNYSDFPSSSVGRIPLQTAVANSCNTAFIGAAPSLSRDDLAKAASSLGMGTDYDVGFPAFFGSVPATDDAVTKGANMIGQGQIEASPMAMAGVVASVSSGRTTVPWLIEGHKPTAKGTPLTASEAAALKSMTTAVVTSGSGRGLQGIMIGGKTGTAEYGTASPPKTHAWMVAWRGDVAVAVLVHDGESGSKAALPIMKKYLES